MGWDGMEWDGMGWDMSLISFEPSYSCVLGRWLGRIIEGMHCNERLWDRPVFPHSHFWHSTYPWDGILDRSHSQGHHREEAKESEHRTCDEGDAGTGGIDR